MYVHNSLLTNMAVFRTDSGMKVFVTFLNRGNRSDLAVMRDARATLIKHSPVQKCIAFAKKVSNLFSVLFFVYKKVLCR